MYNNDDKKSTLKIKSNYDQRFHLQANQNIVRRSKKEAFYKLPLTQHRSTNNNNNNNANYELIPPLSQLKSKSSIKKIREESKENIDQNNIIYSLTKPSQNSNTITRISNKKSVSRFSPKIKLIPTFNFLLTRTYDQQSGPWPEDHPLPLPLWSEKVKPAYNFKNIFDFEELASLIENTVQHLLQEHNYNSVTNFLKLYMDFKRSDGNCLAEFFQKHTPEITDDHLTCVGLGLELRKRIINFETKYPGLTECLYMVSSEEHVDNLDEYLNNESERWVYSVEKEHVLVALRISICGRNGIVLCDPGYHIARVIIIMEDEAYPHTGRFTQSEESAEVKKEYEYKFNKLNPSFVNWIEYETKNGVLKQHETSLIFIERAYLTAVDLTERRNFVYDFRSLLARNLKGHLIAGVYFPVRKGRKDFTIFYEGVKGQKEKMRLNFDDFLNPDQLDEKTLEMVSICNEQLHLATNLNLLQHLVSLAYLINDEEYIEELLTINREINEMT